MNVTKLKRTLALTLSLLLVLSSTTAFAASDSATISLNGWSGTEGNYSISGTTVTVNDTVSDVEFVLSDNANGGMYVNFRDGASMLMYVTADGIIYYAASADMYCYESTETARAEYLAGLGLTATLDALVCND